MGRSDRTGSATGATAPPWWLVGDGERCAFCHTAYAYEVEVRCTECDRPSCPHCAVTVQARAERYCRDCAPAPGGEAR